MGRQGNHLGLLVTVHVDAVVFFHALHELLHKNPEEEYEQRLKWNAR